MCVNGELGAWRREEDRVSGFDLPIAVAILALTNQIPVSGLDDYLFAGELGLDGSVNAVSGEVAYQLLARDNALSFAGGQGGTHVPVQGVACGILSHIGHLRLGIEAALGMPVSTEAPADPLVPPLDYGDVGWAGDREERDCRCGRWRPRNAHGRGSRIG